MVGDQDGTGHSRTMDPPVDQGPIPKLDLNAGADQLRVSLGQVFKKLLVLDENFWLPRLLIGYLDVSIILKTIVSQILDLAIDEQNSVNFTFLKK